MTTTATQHVAYIIGRSPVDLLPYVDGAMDDGHVAGEGCPCGPTRVEARLGADQYGTVYVHHAA